MFQNVRGFYRVAVGLFVAMLFVFPVQPSGALGAPAGNESTAGSLPSVDFREVPLLQMPGLVDEGYSDHTVDSNSPAFWDGDTFYLFNSWLHPWRFSGPDIYHLSSPLSTKLGRINNRLWVWIESVWRDEDGTLYGAYHYEPDNLCSANHHLPTAPKIGWMRSVDNGQTWTELGFVLTPDPANIDCETKSLWDSGGEGDFSIMLDQKKEYFYFFFSSYVKNFQEQGVSVARMRYADRDNPTGKAWKWYKGKFQSPGINGPITPIWPAKINWHGGNADLFWGPSIHWNTYLHTFVIVLNHAIDSKMTQEGIYVSYNSDLANAEGWSTPQKILSRERIMKALKGLAIDQSNGWYPEVIGTDKGESDRLCGRTGRFFMNGFSRLEIVFKKPGE